MSDVVARAAAFFPAAWRRRVASCGGVVHEADGLAVCLTGAPSPVFNPTMVERPPADPDAAIAAAERHYEGTGFSMGIDLDAELHADVRAAADRAGLRLVESRPAMTVAVPELPYTPPPDGVELLRVEDPALLDQVVDVDAAAFGGDAAVIRRFLPDAVLDDPAQRVYAARIDGQVVAAGESALHDAIVGVFGVATIPSARRRGIGAALTAFVIADRAADAELALLDASDLGKGVYERLGFRTVSTWEVWVRRIE